MDYGTYNPKVATIGKAVYKNPDSWIYKKSKQNRFVVAMFEGMAIHTVPHAISCPICDPQRSEFFFEMSPLQALFRASNPK